MECLGNGSVVSYPRDPVVPNLRFGMTRPSWPPGPRRPTEPKRYGTTGGLGRRRRPTRRSIGLPGGSVAATPLPRGSVSLGLSYTPNRG